MTAKGTVFLALEDETGMVNVTLWPDTWARLRGIVRRHALLLVDGELQREASVVNVVATTPGPWSRRRPRSAGRAGRPAFASSAGRACVEWADGRLAGGLKPSSAACGRTRRSASGGQALSYPCRGQALSAPASGWPGAEPPSGPAKPPIATAERRDRDRDAAHSPRRSPSDTASPGPDRAACAR